MRWARRNLFGSPLNSVLTIVFSSALAYLTFRSLRFVFVTGRWTIIRRNLTALLVGLFPRTELWRVWIALALLSAAFGLIVGAVARRAVAGTSSAGSIRRTWPFWLLLGVVLSLLPSLVTALAIAGVLTAARAAFAIGRRLPVPMRSIGAIAVAEIITAYALLTAFGGARPEKWGGLMLTITLTIVSLLLAFPFGVALAVGRRSTLPAIRWASIAYIELIRGVPLLTLLFMGSFVLGFVLPSGMDKPSLVTRAIVAFVMFTAAYIAEIVRGGLQAVGRGQSDAALALGLGHLATLRFVVLPQALRAVIPGLVGQFITLFKDTSLVAIIGLSELLGISQILTSQGDFLAQGLHAETLAFASFVYWTISYTMSRESQRLERRLGVGVR